MEPSLRVVGHANVFALGDINDVKEDKLGELTWHGIWCKHIEVNLPMVDHPLLTPNFNNPKATSLQCTPRSL